MKRIRFADAGFEIFTYEFDVIHNRFGNVQELRFENVKSSYMGCVTLLEGRFFDAPKSSFQDSKFRIWAAKRSIRYFSEIAFSGGKMFKY